MSLTRLHLVMVPTTDADRAIAFFGRLGLEVRVDTTMAGGGRWVELALPQGAAGVALVPGTAETVGVPTGMVLVADDLDATHARLRDEGADVDAVIARPGSQDAVHIGAALVVGPTPAMFFVRDPDGNELLVIGE